MENTLPNTQPTSAAAPDLTVSDLQNIRALIETAVRRGAFQAQELSAVGSVFDRLSSFLTAVSAASKPENQ